MAAAVGVPGDLSNIGADPNRMSGNSVPNNGVGSISSTPIEFRGVNDTGKIAPSSTPFHSSSITNGRKRNHNHTTMRFSPSGDNVQTASTMKIGSNDGSDDDLPLIARQKTKPIARNGTCEPSPSQIAVKAEPPFVGGSFARPAPSSSNTSASSRNLTSIPVKSKLEDDKTLKPPTKGGPVLSDAFDGLFSPKKETISPVVRDKAKARVEPKKNAESAVLNVDKPSDEVKPLVVAPKRPAESSEEDEDDEPLSVRKAAKKQKIQTKKELSSDEESSRKVLDKRKHEEKEKKKHKEKHKKIKQEERTKLEVSSSSVNSTPSPAKKRKKNEEEEQQVWRWWEEHNEDSSVKWKTLEHKGPVFAPAYEPLPNDVHFKYNGKAVKLSLPAEEVAVFYGKMLEHEYTTKDVFRTNFFKDWRKTMSSAEKELIKDLNLCDFREICEYFKKKSEERKNMSKEEKLKIKEEKEKLMKEYGYALMDGYKQKIANFNIEPPGLFRGRGDHPKMGMLKRRTQPEDVIINCGKGTKVPAPPEGHKWKEVRHDNTVTWLACWNENILGNFKYVMLNPSSKLKGQKDWQKYETARKLKKRVNKIRENYRSDWKDKSMMVRQRAVALYLIDKLALRAGNEKEEGETADTVGCCSLRVEHINLVEKDEDGQQYVVEFDFLGKDSIRYFNKVAVEKRVFKNLNIFMENKGPGDDLFDRLNTTILNKYLQSLMPGLTAKVFRTFNASITLQEQLKEKTLDAMKGNEHELILAYNRANRAVAILCNHQRTAPKTHQQQMENLGTKIAEKKAVVKEARQEYKAAKADYNHRKNDKNKKLLEQKKRKMETLEKQLKKMELQATDKEENKLIALSTSKLNYLDPRITVQWCLKWKVPITKVYNKTQREKFQWAIDMVTKSYEDTEQEFEF